MLIGIHRWSWLVSVVASEAQRNHRHSSTSAVMPVLTVISCPTESDTRSRLNKSSQSYGVSLAVWDHTVLPSTRHKWTHTSQTGWYSIYLPQRDGLPKDWRRRPGCPRHTWLRTLNADLHLLNHGLNSAWRLAQDRKRWRQLVEMATLQPGARSWWWCWKRWKVELT